MLYNVLTIEDLLEIVSGLSETKLDVKEDSTTIVASIARQVLKGTPLSDRQYALMKEKLHAYRSNFLSVEIDFDLSVQNLRMPLRHIDRSKYIQIVSTDEVYEANVYESYKQDWKWIKIKFPFSKKLISVVDSISNSYRNYYVHKKGTHIHFFKLRSDTVYDIVSAFKERNFEIDEDILEYYEQIKLIKENPEQYQPMYYDNSFVNFPESALKVIEEELGSKTNVDILKVVDRKFRYGFKTSNIVVPDSTLTGSIANRNHTYHYIDSNKVSLDAVVNSLLELDRFPVLVLVNDESALDEVTQFYNATCNLIPASKQIVLFRDEKSDDYNINNFIVEKKLSNWLDKTTEVVYINNKKFNKILLKTDWKPMCNFSFANGFLKMNLRHYISDKCDLELHYNKEHSLFLRRDRRLGYM